ncbi:MAG: transcription-repair coupling factor [Pseudomonadota bacterium]
MIENIVNRLDKTRSTIICGAPEGLDALLLGDISRQAAGRDIVVVARDAERAASLADTLAFFVPEAEVLAFPAWDCLPYDRVSPNPTVSGERVAALAALADGEARAQIVITTAGGFLQRVPPREVLRGAKLAITMGEELDRDALQALLARGGYSRTGTVMEPGDYALRGDIVDIFPTGEAQPVRIDLFGDEVEALRRFDPMNQRSTGRLKTISLRPASEVLLDEATIARFRRGYHELFGIAAGNDPLFEAVMAGSRYAGMEHWLPLYYERLETLADYLDSPIVVLDHRIIEARDARLEVIRDHFSHRVGEADAKPAGDEAPPYKPVPPERLYLNELAWDNALADAEVIAMSPFSEAPSGDAVIIDAAGRRAHDFSAERQRTDVNLFDEVASHVQHEQEGGRRVIVAGATVASRNRLTKLLLDHGVPAIEDIANWQGAEGLASNTAVAAVLSLDHGFEAPGLLVLTEQDIVGDRIGRPARKRTRSDAERFLTEASQIGEGDYVVHVDHGIGRFDGLQTLTRGEAPHDCLRIVYDGDDKLFVPVENIDVLSRYGSHDTIVQLDRLGSASWQSRRAKLKERIQAIAGELLKVAAERKLQSGPRMTAPQGLYDEFCARFPFHETEDQERAIGDVAVDLAAGRAMDRLVCGDVGFGKTEVALRAAFLAVMAGYQVAVVVPTTLLARQHHATFVERFRGLPVKIAQLSRFVGTKDVKAAKQGLFDGTIDIAIGTHALLAKDVTIKNLGLLIVDEEQHFGVKHKERLKQMKANVHVLTLTATPIPRTLQMSLTGVKDLSLIATAPVDRLAVRTFVTPFDSVTVREAIRREQLRGGQTFFVCPRISDLEKVRKRLEELVPEARFAIAHGRMASGDLEHVMGAFYDAEIDVLISTTIIESGLDIPNVNTMIVYRSDMFGLAQLYQLRGRIGRAKARAYAYLTLPPGKKLNRTAERRLEVMQRLDSLGAGFSLASHDLDIRGAGNLLGTEQSGHIKEVGIELYQQMLEEAVHAAKAAQEGRAETTADTWSPEINIGTAVLIPDDYVRDLDVRLGLYRRIAALESQEEIDDLAEELTDRFGELPKEVQNLLDIVAIKGLCRMAGIAKVDSGPRGASVAFHGEQFANPAGLVDFIAEQAGMVKLRPDHRLVATRVWEDVDQRLTGTRTLIERLAAIARAGEPAVNAAQ